MSHFHAFTALLALALPCSALAQIAVGPNAHISNAHRTMMLSEPAAAASPTDPNRLIACATVFNTARARESNLAVYLSTDGGRTWKPTLSGTTFPYGVDATCAFSPNGDAYATAIWI